MMDKKITTEDLRHDYEQLAKRANLRYVSGDTDAALPTVIRLARR